MKKVLLTVALASMTLLGGCAVVDNEQRDDYSIQRKAAQALGTSADKVQIKNRTADLVKVEFDAVFNKRTFSCYYTGGVVLTSDVICAPTDGKALPQSACGSLQKALGQC